MVFLVKGDPGRPKPITNEPLRRPNFMLLKGALNLENVEGALTDSQGKAGPRYIQQGSYALAKTQDEGPRRIPPIVNLGITI